MNKQQEQLNDMQTTLNRNSYRIDLIHKRVWFLKVFCIIFIILLAIIFLMILISYIEKQMELPNKHDYCDHNFGEGYEYNYQSGEPMDVRSCDFIEKNGEKIVMFFSWEDYKSWRKSYNEHN